MKLFSALVSTCTIALSSIASALPEGIEHIQTLEGIEEYRLHENGLRVLLMPSRACR